MTRDTGQHTTAPNAQCHIYLSHVNYMILRIKLASCCAMPCHAVPYCTDMYRYILYPYHHEQKLYLLRSPYGS